MLRANDGLSHFGTRCMSFARKSARKRLFCGVSTEVPRSRLPIAWPVVLRWTAAFPVLGSTRFARTACMDGSDLGGRGGRNADRMVGPPEGDRKDGSGRKRSWKRGFQGSEIWTTTLPRLRPLSTRLWASAMKAKG